MAEAEELFELVRNRYGARLTAEELAEVKSGVERIAEMVQALRAFKLDARDEPMHQFRPYRSEGA
ncbi:MAG: hypothetical protein HY533_02280 [Chloroflexi bacterium]|nr:hypothetical protein [Chloroflexota bacterium]